MVNYEEEDAEIMEQDFSESIRQIRSHQPLFKPPAEPEDERREELDDEDHFRSRTGT